MWGCWSVIGSWCAELCAPPHPVRRAQQVRAMQSMPLRPWSHPSRRLPCSEPLPPFVPTGISPAKTSRSDAPNRAPMHSGASAAGAVTPNPLIAPSASVVVAPSPREASVRPFAESSGTLCDDVPRGAQTDPALYTMAGADDVRRLPSECEAASAVSAPHNVLSVHEIDDFTVL